MKLHAIQTGSVRIKTAQVDGRGRGLRRRLAVVTDRNWTEWPRDLHDRDIMRT